MQSQTDMRPGGANGAAGAAPGSGDLLRVPLSKPLPTHKGDVRDLAVRIPDFAEFIELGEITSVLRFGETPEGQPILKTQIDRDKLMAWAARLTGVDRAILGTLPPVDSYRLSLAVTRVVEIFTQGNSPSGLTS